MLLLCHDDDDDNDDNCAVMFNTHFTENDQTAAMGI